MKLLLAIIGGVTLSFATLLTPTPEPAGDGAYPAPISTAYPAGYPAPAPVLPTATPYAMQTPTSAPTWTPVATDPAPGCPPETPGCVP